MTDSFFRVNAAFLLAVALCANAQGATRAKHVGGLREGIKVHGHWTIEVRNPDGELVTRREFENSLNDPQALVGPISRTVSIGLWEVDVGATGGGAGPCVSNIPGGFCSIIEPNSTATSSFFFKNLTVNTTNSGAQLVLSGSATASQNGSINNVQTGSRRCPSSVLPANCLDNTQGSTIVTFTETGIFPAIPISNGQLILVTVTISFS